MRSKANAERRKEENSEFRAPSLKGKGVMKSNVELNGMSDAELEEWFLAHAQDDNLSRDKLIAVIEHFMRMGQADKAEVCADLLQESLAERGAEDDLFTLLKVRARWHNHDVAFRSECEKWLSSYFGDKPSIAKYVCHAGFDKNLPVMECLRRFQVLRKLQPGVLCFHKTWGFGVVAELDNYAQQTVVDFEKRKQHRMSFSYVGETVQILGDDHVLVNHYRDPRGFAVRVEQEPAEVVKSVILSFGPMSISQIQELMAGRMMPADHWKSFRERARKELKDDPLVVMPLKRNEQIRLLEKEQFTDDQWISLFQKERNSGRIVNEIDKLKSRWEAPDLPDSLKHAVEDRLSYVILGKGKKQWGMIAHAVVLTDELNIQYQSGELKDIYLSFFQPDTLLDIVQKLPIRLIPRFLRLLFKQDRLRSVELLLEVMPELTFNGLNAAINFLLETDNETRVIECIRSSVTLSHPGINMIYWLCRHLDFSVRSGILTADRLAFMALNALETGHISGERAKVLNQLRTLFENDDWLKTVIGDMNDLLRRDFTLRLKHSQAWQEGGRIALLSRVIQLFPELRDKLADALPARTVKRLTSWRSYLERQARLLKIVNEDIPRNSREIGEARTYGDLRENYEYKAAREMQGILMQRRHELERMLKEVESTTFDNFPADKAGMGTSVTIQHDDGRKDQYVILGEWDHDDKLGIISSKSKLAQALEGHKTGDQVVIPGETGQALCTIMEISGLSNEIKTWCRE